MNHKVTVYSQRMDFKTLIDIEVKALTGLAPDYIDTIENLRTAVSAAKGIELLIIDDPDGSITPDLPSLASVKRLFTLKETSAEALQSILSEIKAIIHSFPSSTEDYISIPVDSFIHFKNLPFDLFVKIANGKYLKRIPANEEIDEFTINAFKAKGLKELHFEKKFNREFSNMLLNNMITKVELTYSSEEEKFKAANEVFLTTRDIVQSIGLPPKVVEVCESVMERITQDVKANKDKFSTYLMDIKTSSNLNFQFRFIELSSYIATQIVTAIDEHTKDDQIKAIVFATFFCDISLKHASHLNYRTEESMKELWPQDKKLIKEHAIMGCEVVLKYKNAPSLAAEVVKQHHGSLNGIGFPKEISEDLLPLAKCLMASQEIAFAILKSPTRPPKEVIEGVARRFENTPIHTYILLFESNLAGG